MAAHAALGRAGAGRLGPLRCGPRRPRGRQVPWVLAAKGREAVSCIEPQLIPPLRQSADIGKAVLRQEVGSSQEQKVQGMTITILTRCSTVTLGLAPLLQGCPNRRELSQSAPGWKLLGAGYGLCRAHSKLQGDNLMQVKLLSKLLVLNGNHQDLGNQFGHLTDNHKQSCISASQ